MIKDEVVDFLEKNSCNVVRKFENVLYYYVKKEKSFVIRVLDTMVSGNVIEVRDDILILHEKENIADVSQVWSNDSKHRCMVSYDMLEKIIIKDHCSSSTVTLNFNGVYYKQLRMIKDVSFMNQNGTHITCIPKDKFFYLRFKYLPHVIWKAEEIEINGSRINLFVKRDEYLKTFNLKDLEAIITCEELL